MIHDLFDEQMQQIPLFFKAEMAPSIANLEHDKILTLL